jgi:hypothetical protein
MKYIKTKKHHQSGFIALFFILGISFTFLTWITLTSEHVFEYIAIKREFIKNRTVLEDRLLCADVFTNNMVKANFNLDFTGGIYSFYRGEYFADSYVCQINSISVVYNGNKIDELFFISGDFSFDYKFKNGYIYFIKSFTGL